MVNCFVSFVFLQIYGFFCVWCFSGSYKKKRECRLCLQNVCPYGTQANLIRLLAENGVVGSFICCDIPQSVLVPLGYHSRCHCLPCCHTHEKRGASSVPGPRFEGSRIALSVKPSNAESPTPMYVNCMHNDLHTDTTSL